MIEAKAFDQATASLEAWLETTRGPHGVQGYGGPVAHWWQQSLLYTGPGFDWRYEGIIQGYLALWRKSGEPRWVEKARRAAQDLLQVQLADGHYPFSAFEINPASGGTPHEAAVCLGLLALAEALKEIDDPFWQPCLAAAEKTLRGYYLDKLWDVQAQSFRDHPDIPSFVPNKAATASQAFFAWSKLSGDARWAEQYALPNLERVLAHQAGAPGRLHGAIAQNSFGSRVVTKYMPYYIARCVPGLLQGYQWSGEEKYLEGARLAMDFVLRQRTRKGGLLPALYPNGQANRWPVWIAALGDVLLAAERLMAYGVRYDLEALQRTLLDGQDASGGVQTGGGFSAQTGGQPAAAPDFRDLLHVSGWCDKTFHWLATHTSGAPLPPASSQPCRSECTFQGLALEFYEDPQRVQVVQAGKTAYLWIKGESWAREVHPAFWLH